MYLSIIYIYIYIYIYIISGLTQGLFIGQLLIGGLGV